MKKRLMVMFRMSTKLTNLFNYVKTRGDTLYPARKDQKKRKNTHLPQLFSNLNSWYNCKYIKEEHVTADISREHICKGLSFISEYVFVVGKSRAGPSSFGNLAYSDLRV